MASLVCRWLEMTDGGADPSAGGDPPSATADAAGGGADSEAAAGARLDEAFYLRQLAAERFDPQHFATVFTSGGSGAPQWLNGLIATPGAPRSRARWPGLPPGPHPQRPTCGCPGLSRPRAVHCRGSLFSVPPGRAVQELPAPQLCHPQDPDAARQGEGGAAADGARCPACTPSPLRATSTAALPPSPGNPALPSRLNHAALPIADPCCPPPTAGGCRGWQPGGLLWGVPPPHGRQAGGGGGGSRRSSAG